MKVLLLLLCAGDEPVKIPESRGPRVFSEIHKVVAGEDWYWVRFPEQYSAKRPAPLALLLHGRNDGDGDPGAEFVKNALAGAFHARGWIVVAPSMMKRHKPTWADADDYLLGIVRHFRTHHAISNVLIGGFSAGGYGAMAYGLSHPWEFDAVIALAGGAVGRADDAKKLPVFMAVGKKDEKTYHQTRAQAETLRGNGFEDVTFREYAGLGHEISEAELGDIAAWIESRQEKLAMRRTHKSAHLYGRVSKLTAEDADGWGELGVWARLHGFVEESAEAFKRALAANPQHGPTRAALGHWRLDGKWSSKDELAAEMKRLTLSERNALLKTAEKDLSSSDPDARKVATLRLLAIGSESSLEPLLAALKAEPERAVVIVLEDALLRQKPRSVGVALQKWAGDARVHPDAKVAALELLDFMPDEVAVPVTLSFYFQDAAARPVARCILANQGDAALARLAPIFSDKDPKNVALAVAAAGEIRSKRAVPALVKLLGHSDERVHCGAKEALCRIGKPAVPDLIGALDGPHKEAAHECLKRVTGKEFAEKQKWIDWARDHKDEIDPK